MNKIIPHITFQHYWKAVDQTPQTAAPHDICNKANQIALAEQSTNTGVPLITIEQIAATYPNESAQTQFSVLTRCNNEIIAYNKANERTLISAEEAKELAGEAEYYQPGSNRWIKCDLLENFSATFHDGEVIKYRAIKRPEQYITSDEARKLGVGNAEALYNGNWITCNIHCIYPSGLKYRAIKQPEPVEQWQENDNSRGFDKLAEKQHPELLIPTCQVRNEDTGELKTMTREAAKLLQAETKDVCDWFYPEMMGNPLIAIAPLGFGDVGIYTYKLKANLVKLTIDDEPSQMLTPSQCEAERLALIDTHDVESRSNFACCRIFEKDDTANWFAFDFNGAEYRLIRKQPKLIKFDWTQPLLKGCATNFGEWLRKDDGDHPDYAETILHNEHVYNHLSKCHLIEPTNANWQVYIQGETDLTTLKGVGIEIMYWCTWEKSYVVTNEHRYFENEIGAIKAYRITGLADGYCYGGAV